MFFTNIPYREVLTNIRYMCLTILKVSLILRYDKEKVRQAWKNLKQNVCLVLCVTSVLTLLMCAILHYVLTYFLFGYEIRLFGGLWCLHFHFVPFLSLLCSVLYALIIRNKSRRAYTSLHTMLFIKEPSRA